MGQQYHAYQKSTGVSWVRSVCPGLFETPPVAHGVLGLAPCGVGVTSLREIESVWIPVEQDQTRNNLTHLLSV